MTTIIFVDVSNASLDNSSKMATCHSITKKPTFLLNDMKGGLSYGRRCRYSLNSLADVEYMFPSMVNCWGFTRDR